MSACCVLYVACLHVCMFACLHVCIDMFVCCTGAHKVAVLIDGPACAKHVYFTCSHVLMFTSSQVHRFTGSQVHRFTGSHMFTHAHRLGYHDVHMFRYVHMFAYMHMFTWASHVHMCFSCPVWLHVHHRLCVYVHALVALVLFVQSTHSVTSGCLAIISSIDQQILGYY